MFVTVHTLASADSSQRQEVLCEVGHLCVGHMISDDRQQPASGELGVVTE